MPSLLDCFWNPLQCWEADKELRLHSVRCKLAIWGLIANGIGMVTFVLAARTPSDQRSFLIIQACFRAAGFGLFAFACLPQNFMDPVMSRKVFCVVQLFLVLCSNVMCGVTGVLPLGTLVLAAISQAFCLGRIFKSSVALHIVILCCSIALKIYFEDSIDVLEKVIPLWHIRLVLLVLPLGGLAFTLIIVECKSNDKMPVLLVGTPGPVPVLVVGAPSPPAVVDAQAGGPTPQLQSVSAWAPAESAADGVHLDVAVHEDEVPGTDGLALAAIVAMKVRRRPIQSFRACSASADSSEDSGGRNVCVDEGGVPSCERNSYCENQSHPFGLMDSSLPPRHALKLEDLQRESNIVYRNTDEDSLGPSPTSDEILEEML